MNKLIFLFLFLTLSSAHAKNSIWLPDGVNTISYDNMKVTVSCLDRDFTVSLYSAKAHVIGERMVVQGKKYQPKDDDKGTPASELGDFITITCTDLVIEHFWED